MSERKARAQKRKARVTRGAWQRMAALEWAKSVAHWRKQ